MVFQGQTTQHRFQVWSYSSVVGLLANRALVYCVVTLLACFDDGTSLLLTRGAGFFHTYGTSINDWNTSKHASKFAMCLHLHARATQVLQYWQCKTRIG